jgi:cytochrome c oxidase subunit IV
MSSREVTLKQTLVAGAALLGLWLLSWALSYAHQGAWSLPVALAIAATKAMLVLLIFMELWTESASFNIALITAGVLIAVFMAFVVGDVVTRAKAPLPPPTVRYPLEDKLP